MLETERLLLRPLDETDVDRVFAMRSDADVMRFIRPPQTSRRETQSWIKLVSSRWAGERIGFCAVTEKSGGRFAGWCGLWRLAETGETEIGYALLREFWGKGYASEAARAFLHYGFDRLQLEKIVAVARPENRASRRVMERLGMRFDRIGRFYESDLAYYSIGRDEFLRQKNSSQISAEKLTADERR